MEQYYLKKIYSFDMNLKSKVGRYLYSIRKQGKYMKRTKQFI